MPKLENGTSIASSLIFVRVRSRLDILCAMGVVSLLVEVLVESDALEGLKSGSTLVYLLT